MPPFSYVITKLQFNCKLAATNEEKTYEHQELEERVLHDLLTVGGRELWVQKCPEIETAPPPFFFLLAYCNKDYMLAVKKGRLKDQNVKNVVPNILSSLKFYKQKIKLTTRKCPFRQMSNAFF